MDGAFQAVCKNFEYQAAVAKKMGSPFYSELLRELGGLVTEDSAIGKVFCAWQGDPRDDAVALRFVAALHYLVITEQEPQLADIFPPRFKIKGAARASILRQVIAKHESLFLNYLESPPQTNEVGRSMVLLGGFLEVAKHFGPDMDVFEIGASAGLNMAFDQYFYKTDDWQWGNADSPVQFKPDWQGPPPPLGAISVHRRVGCDISPINAATEKNRLLSYVWPDQFERIERIRGAIDLASQARPVIDKMEATEWLKHQNASAPRERPRVFYHSIIWQYFTEAQKSDFSATMELMGSEASATSPVIWLRLEPDENRRRAELRISVWPDQTEHVLAQSGFHGEWIKWKGV